MLKTPSRETIYYVNMLIVERTNQLDLSLMFAQVTQLTPNLLCPNNGD